jgi:hypothetical protein
MNVDEYPYIEKGNIDEDENMLLEEAANAYQRNTGRSIEEFDEEDLPDSGNPQDTLFGEEERFNAIASAIILQRQRRAYFDAHILPLTGWGMPQFPSQAASGHLPGDILPIRHVEGEKVWLENVIGKIRQAESAACYGGCITNCSCQNFDEE